MSSTLALNLDSLAVAFVAQEGPRSHSRSNGIGDVGVSGPEDGSMLKAFGLRVIYYIVIGYILGLYRGY